jgi:S23 ribosomal protein.
MLHTQTRIYQESLKLVTLSAKVVAGLPRGHAHLADQLRRAASSITLNFAEGAGKTSSKDRRRYFMSARGSANEVVAIVDVARCWQAVEERLAEQTVEVADHLAAMLSKYR